MIQASLKSCVSVFLFANLLLFSGNALAQTAVKAGAKVCPEQLGTELPFPKKLEVEIMEYVPKTLTYKVINANLPDEGITDVTLEAMRVGISDIREIYDIVLKDPQSIVGKVYMTSTVLPTLTDKELAARVGCVRKK